MTGGSATVALMLGIVATVFIVIAVYVERDRDREHRSSTIVAGRARSIALLRLSGRAPVRSARRIATEGLLVGLVGAVIGVVVGTAVAAGLAGGRGWRRTSCPRPTTAT